MRPTRELEENAIYHVMFRANLQENIFIKDEDKDMVEKVLFCKKKYQFHLKNHVIMDNHVHLLIKPVGEKEILSTIMQSIKSSIAIKYNNKYNRKGHLCYDRFKSIIVRDPLYYRTIIKYITNNPVVKANLANDIYSYKYSGLYHLMRKQYYLIDEPDEIMRELYPFLPSDKMDFSTHNVITQNMSSSLKPWSFLDFSKDIIK